MSGSEMNEYKDKSPRRQQWRLNARVGRPGAEALQDSIHARICNSWSLMSLA